MIFGKYTCFTTLALLISTSLSAQADTLAINTLGALSQLSVPGQSITTPTGGPFNSISFNWFDGNLAPTAAGTLFVLNQSYAGLAGDLSATTPGFIAASQSIMGGQYLFDSTVTLQEATQYFFYTNDYLTFLGDGNRYQEGNLYLPDSDDITKPFINLPRLDADFQLSGTPVTVVPESSTLAFLFGSTLTGVAFLRCRKSTHKAT